MRFLSLDVLTTRFAIVRLPADAGLPWWAADSSGRLSLTRTSDETSIVCESDRVPAGVQAERGYKTFRVKGPLPLDDTGVLASLSEPLARASLPVFVISTYDTDYLLIHESFVSRSSEVLRQAGHSISGGE
jgi:hypothetical protein